MAELTALERMKAKAAEKKLTDKFRGINPPNRVANDAPVIIDDIEEDRDTIDFCGKHMREKKNGVCKICVMEEKHKAEMARRNAAILDGTEKWDKNTCFKKDRQTKKYVKRMMGLTGKAYRKLNIKARRREKNK